MIIAATNSMEKFEKALKSQAKTIFDLNPDILNLAGKIEDAHKMDKEYFVHLDLAAGIGKDKSGLEFLKMLGVDGIISTKTTIIKYAKDTGLKAVQRFFVLDSQSVKTTIDGIKLSKADMVEIMPGIAFKIITKVKSETSVPIIAGGLIETKAEVDKATKSGADIVSTGTALLWDM